MGRLAHLGLEVPKRVRRTLMREDEPHNVDKCAVGKAEYDGFGHDRLLLPTTAARTASRPRAAPHLATPRCLGASGRRARPIRRGLFAVGCGPSTAARWSISRATKLMNLLAYGGCSRRTPE